MSSTFLPQRTFKFSGGRRENRIRGFLSTRVFTVDCRRQTGLKGILKSALKDKFKKIYQAENGLVALEVIKQQQPDIIVSDVMMHK